MEGAEVGINLANSPTFDEASVDLFRTSMTNELGRATLAARQDNRTVITDEHAGMLADITGDVLIAGPDAHLAPTHYRDWIQATR